MEISVLPTSSTNTYLDYYNDCHRRYYAEAKANAKAYTNFVVNNEAEADGGAKPQATTNRDNMRSTTVALSSHSKTYNIGLPPLVDNAVTNRYIEQYTTSRRRPGVPLFEDERLGSREEGHMALPNKRGKEESND